MAGSRNEFLERLTVKLTKEERISRGLEGENIEKLPDRGNVFMNARIQSEILGRDAIEKQKIEEEENSK